MLTEIAKGYVALQKPASRLGDDDLSPVGSCGDARCAVNVDPDVALVRHQRLPGVYSHACPDRTACERLPRLRRRGDGVGSFGKRDEEGIALRVHLDTAMSRERLPQGAAVVV